MVLSIIFIAIGFFLLVTGANFLIDGSTGIAKKFNIPTIIIGFTIVAIGTSMPELMVSTTAALNGHSDISVGNVIGSNMANLLLILGICSVIKPLKFKKETERIENFIILFATILLFYFANNMGNNIITRTEGIIFVACACIFIIYNIFMAKRKDEETLAELQKVNTQSLSVPHAILWIILGIVALKYGGDLVVNHASNIASLLGLSEKLISVTIISFSTSLPELITTITATLKGEVDMAIGDILGSQTFNIFLIIGVSAVLCPINYSIGYNIDMFFLILATIFFVLFPFEGKKHYMSRGNGAMFLTLYIIYISYCVLKIA